ncbi:hypothetical protein NUH86_01830 [Sphingobium sp. JS3065]|uniref:hypothetical protein n=1 Tax=Sphingobium sp. JS3065 TaxID=2970925 RepID=UPI002263AE4E|nr:hypothetical protein [Sphingobium sp. JS3065]UZW55571.1 hypothetical protein NUH86_01830 [Sphingobium sp. JS3065]
MRNLKLIVALAAVAAPIVPATAGSPVLIQAIQTGEESVRYYKGKPTLDLHQQLGSVQVSPFTIDRGSLVFTVAVFNRAGAPVNVGIENVTAAVDGSPYKVMTVEELIKKEQDRARWQKIGLAFLGGLAAYSASQPTTYHSTYSSPWGTSTYTSRYYSPYAAYRAAEIGAMTGFAINAVQDQLDRTTDALGENVMQLTTVDPGNSYAGKVVLAKLRDKRLPKRVRIMVSMNGETYPFEFQVVKMGTPAPTFTTVYRDPAPATAPVPAVSPSPGQPMVQTVKAIAVPKALAIPANQPVLVSAYGGPMKRRADTPSGWCLVVGSDYRGTGSLNSPAVTTSMPRCPI